MVVIFVGAIGGFLASGIIGLFVGSVILGLSFTLFKAWLAEPPQPSEER
jgi:predicted PurR-regulated permease PerM